MIMNTAGAARRRQPRPTNAPKPAKQRVSPPERGSDAEGVYIGARFLHTVTSLVGTKMRLRTSDGRCYEGLFHTVSPTFEVALKMAHEVLPGKPDVIDKSTVSEEMIFPAGGIALIECENVAMDYATKDAAFATDASISRFNGDVMGKDLQRWECPDASDVSLTLEDSANGWDAEEMFKKNAQEFNVISTYDHDLSGYTVALNREDSEEYRKKEEMAAKIAAEIEKSSSSRANADLENGDEEEAFAAVVRPDRRAASPFGGGPNRYVPPNRRLNNKMDRGAPNPVRSGSGNRPPMNNSGPRGPPPSAQTNERPQRSPNGNSSPHPPVLQSPTPQHNTPTYAHPAPSTQTTYSNSRNPHPVAEASGGPVPPFAQDSKPRFPPTDSKRGNDGAVKMDSSAPLPQREEASARRAQLAQEKRSQENKKQEENARSGGTSPAQPQSSSLMTNTAPAQTHHGPPSGPKMRKQGGVSPGHHGGHHVHHGQHSQQGPHMRQSHAPPQQQQQPSAPPPQPSPNPSAAPAGKGRDDAALKKFGRDFQLSDQGSSQRVEPAAAVVAPMTASTPVSAAPVPAATPTNRPAEPVKVETPGEAASEVKDAAADAPAPSPGVSDKVLHSTLNPNAKEFVLNPNAKAFTPRVPSTATPPRVQTPQHQPTVPLAQLANLTLHPGPGNPGMGGPVAGGLPPNAFQYCMPSYMSVIPVSNPQYQGKPRFKGVGAGGGNGGPPGPGSRADMAAQAAVTGQPILASSAGIPGMQPFFNYAAPPGTFAYPQVYMMNPGAMPVMPGLSFNLEASGALGQGPGGPHHPGPQSHAPQVSQGYVPGPNAGGNHGGHVSTPRSTPGPAPTGPPQQQLIYHTGGNSNPNAAGTPGVPTSSAGPSPGGMYYAIAGATYGGPPPGSAGGHHPGGGNPGTMQSPGNHQSFTLIPHSMAGAPPTQASIYSSVASAMPFGATIVTGPLVGAMQSMNHPQ